MDELGQEFNKAGETALLRYLKNTKETMYKLRKKGALVDVVLYCGNLIGFAENRLSAHKVILASCSPFFFSRCSEDHVIPDLSKSPSLTNISLMIEKEKNITATGMKKIEIPDVDVGTMEVIIEFMYTGRLSLNIKNHPAIGKTMIAARKLKVDELYRRCAQTLTQGLTANNCIDLWDIADKCHDENLANRVITFLADRFSVCYKSSRYMLLDLNRFKKVISTVLSSNHSPEDVILRCIFNWVQHDRFIREICIQEVFKCCQLPSVSDRIVSCITAKDFSNEIIAELQEEMRLVRHRRIIQLEKCGDKSYDSRSSTPASQTRLIRRTGSGTNSYQNLTNSLLRIRDSETSGLKLGATEKMSVMSIKSPSRKVLCVCQTRGSNNYFQTFDPTTDEWNPPLPGPQTPFPANAAIAESQGCIYVMGGVSKNGDKINTCSKLSLKSMEWNTSPAMKVKKSHATAIGCSEFIYVIGGESKYGTALGNAERFDPIGEVWRMLPSMRKPRRSSTVQVIKNGRVFVMGGYNGAEWILSCEMFDPSNRSWTELSPLPNHEFSSGELCSCIYDVTTLSVISCRRPRSIAFYDWEIGTWRREIERVGMTPSSPKAIIPFGDQIYVIDYTRHVFIYYLHSHVWEKVAEVPSGDAKLLFAVLVDNWIEKPKEELKPNVGANAHEQPRSPAGDAAKAHPAHVT